MDQHLTIVDHPLVQHKLTLMRDIATSTAVFRQLLREISQLLAYEVTRNLPMSTRQTETPLMTMDAAVIGEKKLAPAHKRLAQVGLPVEHRVVNRNGSQLNLIFAGPF